MAVLTTLMTDGPTRRRRISEVRGKQRSIRLSARDPGPRRATADTASTPGQSTPALTPHPVPRRLPTVHLFQRTRESNTCPQVLSTAVEEHAGAGRSSAPGGSRALPASSVRADSWWAAEVEAADEPVAEKQQVRARWGPVPMALTQRLSGRVRGTAELLQLGKASAAAGGRSSWTHPLHPDADTPEAPPAQCGKHGVGLVPLHAPDLWKHRQCGCAFTRRRKAQRGLPDAACRRIAVRP